MSAMQDIGINKVGSNDYDDLYPKPYPPVPYHPPWKHVRTWDERTVLTILFSVFCVHAVLILNYLHLRRTQNAPNHSKLLTGLRLVVVILMPTLIWAELIFSIFRTIKIFLFANPDTLTVKSVLENSSRYITGAFGLRVAPRRAFEDDEDVENAEEQGDGTPVEHTDDVPRPALSQVHLAEDLQYHKLKWNTSAVLRVFLLLLALAQSVGTITLAIRRVADSYHGFLGFDYRNLMAAISSILCSISGIVLVACRGEWSLKPLSSWTTQTKPFVLSTFIWELIIASWLYEVPFVDDWNFTESSWVRTLFYARGASVGVWIVCSALLIWFLVWAFQDQLRQTKLITINWHFVLAVPLIALLVWILVDDITMLVLNIIDFFRYNDHSTSEWDRDPWHKYIPFC